MNPVTTQRITFNIPAGRLHVTVQIAEAKKTLIGLEIALISPNGECFSCLIIDRSRLRSIVRHACSESVLFIGYIKECVPSIHTSGSNRVVRLTHAISGDLDLELTRDFMQEMQESIRRKIRELDELTIQSQL